MPNPLPPPRSELVAEIVDELMTVLQRREATDAVRPDEGLIAVELVFLNLFNNAMNGAPTADLKEGERLRHMKTITRMSSRIVAWPAKTHQRM